MAWRGVFELPPPSDGHGAVAVVVPPGHEASTTAALFELAVSHAIRAAGAAPCVLFCTRARDTFRAAVPPAARSGAPTRVRGRGVHGPMQRAHAGAGWHRKALGRIDVRYIETPEQVRPQRWRQRTGAHPRRRNCSCGW